MTFPAVARNVLYVNEARKRFDGQASTESVGGPNTMSKIAMDGSASGTGNRLAQVLRVEWLGQTAASLCWIASVLAYGINSSGDWLQLFAAASWLLANVAAVMTVKSD